MLSVLDRFSWGDSAASENSGFSELPISVAATDGHRSFCESIIASAVTSEGGMGQFGPDSAVLTAMHSRPSMLSRLLMLPRFLRPPQILMFSMISLPHRHSSLSFPCHCGVVARAT